MACRVTELEKACALAQDLDVVRSNHAFMSHDQRAPVSRPPHLPNLIGLVPIHPHIGMMLRARALNRTTETKAPKGNFSRLVLLLNAISANDMGI